MTQRARSPVLGYNHNLRHRGRVFHVQTEDSGPAYARLYTHLFFEGTILSSKKREYDPAVAEDEVRGLMQQLHKMMIKELTHGGYDPHIAAFFTSRGEPAALDVPAPAAVEALVADAHPELPPAPARVSTPAPIAAVAAPLIPSEMTPPGLAPPEAALSPPAHAAAVVRPVAPRPKPVVVVKPSGLRRPPVVLSSSADGVVVRRNVVINVGAGEPQVKGAADGPPVPEPAPARARGAVGIATREGSYGIAPPAPSVPRAAPAAIAGPTPQPLAASHGIQMPWESSVAAAPIAAPVTADPPRTSRQIRMPWDPPVPAGPADAFSGDLVSDKSLDEVILEYLSDDADSEEH